MTEDQIKQKVHNYSENGYHCAEVITRTLLDFFDKGSSVQASRCASGFCGGIGGCYKDVCGALSGGIIVLSCLFGREKGNKNITKLCEISTKYREQFISQFGSTICSTLKDEIEKRNDLESCHDLTAKATVILFTLIEEYNE
jgi:C_GCAxxG_C_C family probable redox protein